MGTQHSTPIFGPRLLWPNGRPSQLLLSTCCTAHDRVSSGTLPPPGNTIELLLSSSHPSPQAKWQIDRFSHFWATVSKTVRPLPNGWIKMPLGSERDLGPGRIVLGRDPAQPLPPKKGGAQPPIFGPCLLWPNGRPSQLLLSTCCTAHDRVSSGTLVPPGEYD